MLTAVTRTSRPVISLGAVRPRQTTTMADALHARVPYTPPRFAQRLKPHPSSRCNLGQFPTPLHPFKLAGTCGIPADVLGGMYIKRDDLTGMQLSGNKVRKLEFLLAEALERGCDSVITIGGIQSNHCRATAVAAKYVGLEPFLILRNSRTAADADPGLVGNLLVERLVGASIRQVTKEEYTRIGSLALLAQLERELVAEGRKPYVIPVGGSNALGTWGYLEFVRELRDQIEGTGVDDIVMACGSGGTTAGIALGCDLADLGVAVHGYGVCDDPGYFYVRSISPPPSLSQPMGQPADWPSNRSNERAYESGPPLTMRLLGRFGFAGLLPGDSGRHGRERGRVGQGLPGSLYRAPSQGGWVRH